MAKRFVDTNKWDDPWYLELSMEHKLCWDFICAKCDPVGVWKPSDKMMSFCIGHTVDLRSFLAQCGERIFIMDNGNWWIKKFCDFQYGHLAEGGKSQTTQYYIKELKKHSLYILYKEGIHTPKEKDKEKEKDDISNGVKNFGPETGDPYFIVNSQLLGTAAFRVSTIDGLQEFFEANMSTINDRPMAEKFLRRRKGKTFKDFQHVWNDLNQFTEKQYA